MNKEIIPTNENSKLLGEIIAIKIKEELENNKLQNIINECQTEIKW